MEGKNVAAFGRLPSPALPDGALYLFFRKMRKKKQKSYCRLKTCHKGTKQFNYLAAPKEDKKDIFITEKNSSNQKTVK